MKWLNTKHLLIIIGLTILLMIVCLTGFHFLKEENKDVNKPTVELPSDDELEFLNESSMDVDYIWNIVTEKREKLQKLFLESSLYYASEIDSSYSKEDEGNYAVFDETFVKTLNELLVSDLYYYFFNKLSLLKETSTHTFYIAEKNVFDEVYLTSAIANVGITGEEIRLISATDDTINVNVKITSCENEEDCKSFDNVAFELKKESEEWKISSFLK